MLWQLRTENHPIKVIKQPFRKKGDRNLTAREENKENFMSKPMDSKLVSSF